jgi:hypothetical protein
MMWIFMLGLTLPVVVAAAWVTANPLSSRAALYPYVKNPSLLSPAERSFLSVLDQLLEGDYRVMGKVRIADLISVEQLSSKRAWLAASNRISANHFDFVLCNKRDLSPIAVIELDDRSHTAKTRQQRDELIEGVCHAASLPLFRLPARDTYTRSDVERLVLSRLPQPLPATPAASHGATHPAPTGGWASRKQVKPPQCPKCNSHMILRKVKRGVRAGDKLWSCRDYPGCRGILPVATSASSKVGCHADFQLNRLSRPAVQITGSN